MKHTNRLSYLCIQYKFYMNIKNKYRTKIIEVYFCSRTANAAVFLSAAVLFLFGYC